MRDIWKDVLGKRVKAVLYKEAGSSPSSQLYIVLEGPRGDEHVEIYAYGDGIRWAGGVDPGGVESISGNGHGRVVSSWVSE